VTAKLFPPRSLSLPLATRGQRERNEHGSQASFTLQRGPFPGRVNAGGNTNFLENVSTFFVLKMKGMGICLHTGCFKKCFTMVVFNVLTMDSLYAFKCKHFRNTSHTVTFGIPLWSSFWNTLRYQCKSHWAVAIPGKTRCVLLRYDSSKHCTCPLNKFI
jgi:hypothetical protein